MGLSKYLPSSYTIYSLFVTLVVFIHFNSNTKNNQQSNHDGDNNNNINGIPVMFDNSNIFNRFSSKLIHYLNNHDMNKGRFNFTVIESNEMKSKNGIFVMVEQHQGFNLKERQSYLKQLKEKMDSLLIITLRYGQFPSTLRELSLYGFDIIELLYIDDDIIRNSDRNEVHMRRMFNWIEKEFDQMKA